MVAAQAFDVFLSHNSRDRATVRELGEALERRGLKVWLDEWELVPGRPWQEALEEIIRTTKSAAVLVGKDGLGPWVKPEMRACLDQFVRRELPVIPVLLPGVPDVPDLPLFLQGFTWVDLRDGLIPEGLERLCWGITGTRPAGRNSSVPAPEREASMPAQTQQGGDLADLVLKGLGSLLGGGGATSSPGHLANAANLSGTWHGTDGLSYNITHMGDQITFRGIHPQHGEASTGEGQVQGNQLNVAFRTIYGAAGQGTLEISGDGQRLTGRVLDQISGSPMLLTLMRS